MATPTKNNRPVSNYTVTTCKRVGCMCQRLVSCKIGEENIAVCNNPELAIPLRKSWLEKIFGI